MTSDALSLASAILIVVPMLYFLIVTPNFFFFKFADPTVTWVMRGLFNVYFLSVGACCALGATAFVAAGRPIIAVGIASVAALAIAARRWFLQRIDAQLRARDAGDTDAVRQLQRLHLGGMLYNTVQFAALLVVIPFVFVTAN